MGQEPGRLEQGGQASGDEVNSSELCINAHHQKGLSSTLPQSRVCTTHPNSYEWRAFS